MRPIWAFLLLASCASAQAIRYTYDKSGRVTGVDYGGGKQVEYTYDASGNLIRRVTVTQARFAALSSASYDAARPLAPEMIAAGFGEGLAASLAVNTEPQLPAELNGTRVEVTDSLGITRPAGLFAVAPTQVNFLVPAGTASGRATIRVRSGAGTEATGAATIAPTSPGIYSANQRGSGVAAAFALTVRPSGERTQTLLFDPSNFNASSVDLGQEGDQVFLLLFGTGIRGHSGSTTASVGGELVPVLGAVPQGQYPGLDQVNIGPLPRSLAGRGELPILVRIDGQQTNAVSVFVR